MFVLDENFRSCRSVWDGASKLRRRALLIEAGHLPSAAHAYRRFDELPIEVKVDLNYVQTRQAVH
jgi:hypothetical protein